MDKSWMMENKYSQRYASGVSFFMKFVRDNMGVRSKVRCPCLECLNVFIRSQDEVKDHLLLQGMSQSYTKWIYHGEKFNSEAPSIANPRNGNMNNSLDDNGGPMDDGMHDILEDIFPRIDDNEIGNNGEFNSNPSEEETKKFSKLLNHAQCRLLPEYTDMSMLTFIVKLLHAKVYTQMSNKSVNMILQLLREAFPTSTIPSSYYEATKTLRDLGLNYVPIHACKFDCALFWGEFEDKQYCPVCGTSRWKFIDKKIPWKVLRYFPLKPRLQRLFMSKKIAKDMQWHSEKRIDDDMLRHPADGDAWKEFDKEHEWFSQDPRNVRMGIATDGFNPFGIMSSTYSVWPVVVMPYNLPPWKCMKEPFVMMSLLIPGRNSPGKDIDVYLRPLINELRDLWEVGVHTYDAYKKEKYFQLHATIMWTINDFLTYGDLSGQSTKRYLACLVCNNETPCIRLRNKICYMHRRHFLLKDHVWRRRKLFDGQPENRSKPRKLSGTDLLEQLAAIKDTNFGKHPNNKKRKRSPEELNWTKRSILFELPYWKTLKLRHNLDVMHIEKNICESILGTLLNIEGKTKDTIIARLDLEDLNIKKELHLKKQSNGSYLMPPACYTLSKDEKKKFCEFLKYVKFPDGYASNISRCANANDGKLSGLKSHDCHILLQRLLPVAIRNFVSKDVFQALDELANFFRLLCCKTLKKKDLLVLEADIIIILCKLEKIFPPAFFDVMVHLALHLPQEAMLGGPVHYRWMYPIERFLGKLKAYVRNKARPEGCIAESYIYTECLTFCSMYLSGIETKFNREERNYDGLKNMNDRQLSIFSTTVRPFGASKFNILSEQEFKMIQWYILNNCDEVEPYLLKYKMELDQQSSFSYEEIQKERFPIWFKTQITSLRNQGLEEVSDELFALAYGPDARVRKYTGCIVNGVRFHTKEHEFHLRSQNSGVVVEGNHEANEIDFYGVLTDIIQLDYIKDCKVVIFRCQWFDLGGKRRIHKDGHLTSIMVNRFWYENDPFILAIQAKQVFYVDDIKLGRDWKVVQKFHHRHLFDVPEMQDNENSEIFDVDANIDQDTEIYGSERIFQIEDNGERPLNRQDIAAEVIDSEFIERNKKTNEDPYLEDIDENINEVEEFQSSEDDDSDLDPFTPYCSGEWCWKYAMNKTNYLCRQKYAAVAMAYLDLHPSNL
ncbi:uncharacterized protein LOC120276140 [Dioscorea cayenensis subsp. rotundata]|uniref:Uncharacterized protein LOC120276140 n=1 Tax=Dioscorea cayennensis subsp. rotundata TaxID=55577 RepID=A0AB40CFQ5_DIOCR|nr:uncharacterized protein LOC120276140 [Dioscorea cayenensis subsp. rotundata]